MTGSSPPTAQVSLGRGIAWFGFLAIITAALLALAPVGPTPPLNLSRFGGWLRETGPAAAMLSLVRIFALGTVAYLVVISAWVTILRRHGITSAVLDSVTPHLVQAILTGASTITLAGAVPAAAVSVAVTGPVLDAPTFAQNRQGVGQADAGLEPPVMRQNPRPSEHGIGTTDSAGTTAAGGIIGSQLPTDHALRVDPSKAPGAAEVDIPAIWLVEPGDHLWAIAEEVLGDHLDKSPTTDQITEYWQRLIAQNRQTLIDPDNPDLIQPGQILALPQDP